MMDDKSIEIQQAGIYCQLPIYHGRPVLFGPTLHQPGNVAGSETASSLPA